MKDETTRAASRHILRVTAIICVALAGCNLGLFVFTWTTLHDTSTLVAALVLFVGAGLLWKWASSISARIGPS